MTLDERLSTPYEIRAELAANPAAKKLFNIMAEKKTNLILAADENDANVLLELADKLGPKICVFKTHVDIIHNFTDVFPKKLSELAKKHNFMIFEDRKFADIGNTVKMQYSGGIYKIAGWAHLVNLHIVPGPGIFDAIHKVAEEKDKQDNLGRGIIILSQMTSEGTMAKGEYTKTAVEIANNKKDAVTGHIGAGSVPENLENLASISNIGHVIFTPGIKIEKGGDSLGQRYNTPEIAIKNGSDAIIVGRGIYKADNPLEEAEKYRKAGWNAYLERTNQ